MSTILSFIQHQLDQGRRDLATAKACVKQLQTEKEALEADKARLEALVTNNWKVDLHSYSKGPVYYVWDIHGRYKGQGTDFRSAIDAAIKGFQV